MITGGAVATVTVAPTEAAKATATPAPENYVKVKSVKLNASKITVGTKATFTLTATVNPTNAKYKNITWSSSNKKVATVSKKGKVTAKKAGTATITALTKDGKKATCKVTVKTGVKVTYKLAGGKNNGLNPTYVAKNTKTKLYAPTKKGSTFKGWYVNNKKVTSIKTKKAIKVTAKWEKVKVNAAKIKSAKASGKKITVKYAKVKGANGYEVSYSTNKKFAKKKTTTVTTKKTSVTIKNLKKGTYYVKVAAYKTDSTGAMVKGKASKVLTVKVK
ncbi:MAG: Ig-like domain-containing protein [Lachnospiraceae bacterium]|nr:Ig-like domain-containing protein [Lachnospiraceae bacterium]